MKNRKSCFFILFACLAVYGWGDIVYTTISANMTFSATYGKGYNADTAAGDPRAKEIGAVGYTEGISDKAIVVGEKGWLQYSLKENIRQDDIPGSIEMWIKPLNWSGANGPGATLFHADYDNTTNKKEDERGIFRLYTQGNGRLTFIAGPYPQEIKYQVWAQTDISDWKKGEWHHIVATWNGVDIAIYIDGQQKARNRINIFAGGEDPRFKPALGEFFTVGGSPWGSIGETAVDEVNIYRRALHPGEVNQRYNLKSELIRKEGEEDNREEHKPSMLPLPISKDKPDIDGIITEEEWRDASSVNNFVTILAPEKNLYPYDNRLYCKVSGENLYLAMVSEFNGNVLPTAEAQSNSGKVFMDDCFEIFLTTDKDDDEQIYQIVVNSKGSLDVYATRPDGALITTAVKTAATISKNTWSVELEIPFSMIVQKFSNALPDKLLIQVVRSYKKGNVAERALRQSELSEDISEEYAGFPYNTSFLNIDNYAHLIVTPEGRHIYFDIETKKIFTEKKLSIKGRHSPDYESFSLPLKAIWQGAEVYAIDAITTEQEGTFTYEREVLADFSTVSIDDGHNFNVCIPVASRQALVLKHTIFSFNDTVEVTVDFGNITTPENGFTVELRIKDTGGKTTMENISQVKTSSRIKKALSIEELSAGRYILECVVQDTNGTVFASEQQNFEVFRELPGKGLFDSLTEEVPAPWTPVTFNTEGEVSVWGRVYRFGENFLPKSITALGRELLAAPIFYEVQLAGGELFKIEKGVTRILNKQPAHCKMETKSSSQNISIRQKTTVEYDGMMRYDVEVESSEPITEFNLNVPYLPERAEIFQPGYFRGRFNRHEMNALKITPEFAWTSEYLWPAFWITDMHSGLSWFAATDRTWKVDEGMEKIRVTKEGFIIRFINTDKESVKSIKFTFGLQAFPTKPARDDWREFGRVLESKWISVFVPDDTLEKAVDGMVMPDYFTKILPELWWTRRLRGLMLPFCNFPRSVEDYLKLEPDLHERMVAELYDALEKAQEAGFEYVIPYLSPTYATMSIPEWKFYWSNWIAIPKHIFDSYGQPCVSVANKEWANFWLYSFQNYVERYKIKGVFHDMALPYAEEGTLNGLGYDRNGVRYPEYPIWELRDLYKKTYVIHRKIFPDAMSFMNYGHFLPPVHSFADFLLCAERYETRADRSIYDWDGDGNIDSFRWQSSLPFGPKAMHNGWLKYNLATDEKGPTVHMYGIVLLHDLVQWNINENQAIRKAIHELKKRFGIGYDREIEFLPYWDNGDKYDVGSEDVIVSFYRSGERLMAILVNKRMKETWQGKITLYLKRLGIENVQGIEIYDPMDDTYKTLQNEGNENILIIDAEVSPTLFKALLLN